MAQNEKMALIKVEKINFSLYGGIRPIQYASLSALLNHWGIKTSISSQKHPHVRHKKVRASQRGSRGLSHFNLKQLYDLYDLARDFYKRTIRKIHPDLTTGNKQEMEILCSELNAAWDRIKFLFRKNYKIDLH